MNDAPAPSPRQDMIAVIEAQIAANECHLDRLEREGRTPRIALRDLRVRLRRARAALDELRQEAPDALVGLIQRELATWAGNRDPLPDPRRAAPLPPTGGREER